MRKNFAEQITNELVRINNRLDELLYPSRWYHRIPSGLLRVAFFGAIGGATGAAITYLLHY